MSTSLAESGQNFSLHWSRKLGLLLLSALLLSFALAPFHQFYLAWIGLVPWLVVVASTHTKKSAFLWSWLGGALFFGINMWWLWNVSSAGMLVLTAYLGLFWGLAGWIFVGCRLIPRFQDRTIRVNPIIAIVLMTMILTALEWMRGNWSMFGNQGLPWLYLGTTQSPLLLMCQIADIGGVYAVSFWVAIANFTIVFAIFERKNLRLLIPAFATSAALVVVTVIYGIVRMSSQPVRAGPTVVVIQPNYKQSNSGEKGASAEQILKFHVETTKAALEDCKRRGIMVDLVAWSETMMPPLNASARLTEKQYSRSRTYQNAYDAITTLASEYNVTMIVGGAMNDDWKPRDDQIIAGDRRNSAYFFERTGLMSESRYDKIHLVPFGEFIPYSSIAPIYKLLLKLGPKYYSDYVLTPGDNHAMTVFEVAGGANPSRTDRFVVPICFEDIVGPLVAEMIRGPGGTKRADFIVNLTNDGWFEPGGRWANQMKQHLQTALFRSIENRVPTARAVNTGVSGFVDSVGRVHDTIAPNTEGWAVVQLRLDDRVTFYTMHGDLFVETCAAVTAIVIAIAIWRGKRDRGLKSKD